MKRLQALFFLVLAGLTTATALLMGGLGALPFSQIFVGIAIGALLAAGLARYGAERILAPHREIEARLTALAEDRLEPRLQASIHNEWERLIASTHQSIDRVDETRSSALRSHRRLEAVFAAMGEGVLVLDTTGLIVAANPIFRELLGVWGKIEGRPVREVLRDVEINQLLEDVRNTEAPIVRDIEIHRPSLRTLRSHGIGIPTDGPRDGILVVFHDVSEVRRLDKVRRDFVANASHELRTPLTAIQGYAETLAAGSGLEEGASNQLDVILRNARRMDQLIEDLITLSRIEGAPERTQRAEIDLEQLVQRMLADLGPRIERAELSAELVSPSQPAIAWGDRETVEQILENLITNALRYTDAGGTIQIEFNALPNNGLEVAVTDSGIGIPEEARDRIFERFYRVDASRTRAVGSTGLGLSIAKHLVESLGGTIRVESEVGVGSSFRFTLPRAPTP